MAAMSEQEVRAALEGAGAILSGHFVLTSGRHSDTYVQCACVLEDPALTTRLATAAVERLGARDVDVVAAPAVGGIIFGFAVAQALGVRFIFSEREQGRMAFRRGFLVEPGERVLIAEDVVTTGGSVAEVIELVSRAGGETVAVTSIIDRGGDRGFGAELVSLLRLEVDSWTSSECVQCAAGKAVSSPGSRRLAE